MAAWSTRCCSAGFWGWYWFWRPAWSWSNSSCSSPGITTFRARRPWRSAFMEAVALPWGVFGPEDLRALRRFAAICLFVAIGLPFSGQRSQWARFARQHRIKSAGVTNGRGSEADEVAIVLSDCLRLYEIRLASRASRRRPSDGGGGAVCDWKIGDEGARKVFGGGVTVVPGGGGPERRTVPSGRLQAPGRLTIGPQVANLPHKPAGRPPHRARRN